MSEGVIPRTNAHGVMPGQRKRPPNQRTENRLPERERKHVAFAAKSQDITTPPANVIGTRTGFGQCSAPKMAPATRQALQRDGKAVRRRLVRYDCSAPCCSKQNAR